MSPPITTGLILSVDASDASTITKDGGDRVSLWEDKSVAGDDGDAAGDARPTWVDNQLNGLPIIRFDGVDNVLRFGTDTDPTEITVCMVMKGMAGADFASVLFKGDSSNGWGIRSYQADNDPFRFKINQYDANFISSPASEVANYCVLSCRYDRGLGSANLESWVNGVSQGTDDYNASDILGAGQRLYMGALDVPVDFPWAGDIAEVLIYDEPLSDGDLATVEAYLTSKWIVNTWSAVGADDWSTAAAWSLGHVPLVGENVVFDNTSVEDCTLDVNTDDALGDFTIAATYSGLVDADTFDIDCAILSVSGELSLGSGATTVTSVTGDGSGTLNLETATVICAGAWDLGAGSTITTGASLIRFVGVGAINFRGQTIGDVDIIDALTLAAAMVCADLDVFPGAALNTTGSDFDITYVDMNLQAGGSLVCNGSTINVSGNTVMAAATLAPGTSTFNFNGAAPQSVTSNTEQFTNITLSGVGKVTFIGAMSYTGTLTFETTANPILTDFEETPAANVWATVARVGANTVTLASAAPGTQWDVALTNAATLANMNVTDSNLSGANIDVSDGTSVDGGNNSANWLFPAPSGENQSRRLLKTGNL